MNPETSTADKTQVRTPQVTRNDVTIESFQGLTGRIGIIGGTFDPVHDGHMLDALKVKEREKLDHVVFVPTHRNPLKVEGPIASDEHRQCMLEIAVAPYGGLHVCPMLLHRTDSDYTVDLLARARCQLQADSELFFIAGTDIAENLHQWKRIHEATNLATFCFVPRPGSSLDMLDKSFSDEQVNSFKRHLLDSAGIDISSTAIRGAVAEGKIEIIQTPAGVRSYIRDNGIYLDSRPQNIGELMHAHRSLDDIGQLRGDVRTKGVQAVAEGVTSQLAAYHEPVRVAVAQIQSRPGDLDYNYQRISESIARAEREKADIVIFPELTTVGYFSMDHLIDPWYVAANRRVLNKVCSESEGTGVIAIVGFIDEGPDRGDGRHDRFNAAAVIQDGKIVDVIHKVSLPQGDIFVEPRYFTPGKEVHPVHVTTRQGVELSLGIHICEDLWDLAHPRKVCQELYDAGARVFMNLSGSPFHSGKGAYRYDLLSGKASQLSSPFIYCNAVGVQDGYDGEVLFDGRGMIFDPQGKLIGLGKSFQEDFFSVDLHQPKAVAIPDWLPIAELHDALVMGIQGYCERFTIKNLHIAVSGGLDSGLVAALACEAVGPDRVKGWTMPGPVQRDWRTRLHLRAPSETLSDAYLLASNLGFELKEKPITRMYREWERQALDEKVGAFNRIKFNAQRLLADLGLGAKPKDPLDRIARQNAQARLRGFQLMQGSNDDPGSVALDTGNRTEGSQKYWTYIGDGIGAFGPISDCDKYPEVFDLAHEVNRRAGRPVIPERMIGRPPSAELEENQTDEEGLGSSYTILSPLAAELTSRKVSVQELLRRYPENVVADAVKRQNRGEWGRRQRPPSLRVHSDTFGLGRRIPNSTKWPNLESEFSS